MITTATVLEVRDLSVDYLTDRGAVRAVDRVSFDVAKGEFLGIVGESGCGKSTLLFAIARLLTPPADIAGGSARFSGREMVSLTEPELRRFRVQVNAVVMQSEITGWILVWRIGSYLLHANEAQERMPSQMLRSQCEEV